MKEIHLLHLTFVVFCVCGNYLKFKSCIWTERKCLCAAFNYILLLGVISANTAL